MTDQLLASIAEVEGSMSMLPEAPVAGRVLLVDGDSLAYACAGNDDTTPGEARHKVKERLDSAMRASGSTSCVILLTHTSSHKGYRFAIARAKPYQGSRDHSHKPKQWAYLRGVLEGWAADLNGFPTSADITSTAEADDLFGVHVAQLGWENCVLYVPDKDLRMVPGLHLHWTEHRILRVPPDAFEVIDQDGVVYGEKWFWLQMLQGDSADSIPGLPRYVEGGKEKKIGPKTAEEKLSDITCGWDALGRVRQLYGSYYPADADLQLAEQAALLWMRRDPESHWFDVFRDGNPMAPLRTALLPLMERVEAVRCAPTTG